MTVDWKLVIDCTDPHRQTAFWAAALGYVEEDNGAHIERLMAMGAVGEEAVTRVGERLAWRALAAVRHPGDPVDEQTGTGLGRRLLFQAVPEAKTVKNRLHLDLHVGGDRRDAEVARLVELGATVLATVRDRGAHLVTLADPEGNEFDVM
ncbi:VOC family protein [Spongiactinospora sp. TRM90649]|uniref:VOC family protein n=1 Tax=Spongiactinospora sp. TRM90649 TaxID=3031114 RepID=UPI0023F807E0|nr:VOC family protein [Spongiactinospora sp. TRM90649]MDF5757144.1 VOC family protein [Spongiactinospora sp. TRM90649]